jgi:hypothetical protein
MVGPTNALSVTWAKPSAGANASNFRPISLRKKSVACGSMITSNPISRSTAELAPAARIGAPVRDANLMPKSGVAIGVTSIWAGSTVKVPIPVTRVEKFLKILSPDTTDLLGSATKSDSNVAPAVLTSITLTSAAASPTKDIREN